jgi:hypothetical protein
MKIRSKLPALLGAAAALLLGSGVLALVTDSVTSPGNRVRSPELPNPVDLVVGHTTVRPGGTCQDFSDTTAVPMQFSSDPLVTEGEVLPNGDALSPVNAWCLKNVGAEPISVQVVFKNVVSTELGCGPREVEFDPTCAVPGNNGDLSGGIHPSDSFLMVTFRGAPQLMRIAFSCWAMVGPNCNTVYRTVAELQPGETNVVWPTFEWQDGSDPNGLRKSQSDALQWDIEFRATSVD